MRTSTNSGCSSPTNPEAAFDQLGKAIQGIELHFHSYQQVIHRLIHRLGQFGLTSSQSYELGHAQLRSSNCRLSKSDELEVP